MGSAAYAAARPARSARWTTVIPGAVVTRQPPALHGSRPSQLLDRVAPVFPDLGVLELRQGAVAGDYGWIVTPDGVLLPDHAWHGPGARRGWIRQTTGREFRVERLKGRALSLATFAGANNFGHFLMDSLPRIHLAELAGMGPGDVDHVIVNVPAPRLWPILEQLGIAADRVVQGRPGVALRPDRLIAPSFPGVRCNYQPWLPAWLRARLGPSVVRRHRRIYVPRLHARRILNIDDLLPVLLEHGFETVDPGDHPDPFRMFAEATVVVGVHGAGLTDLAFCAPGTAVLELLPEGHQAPYYYTLADSAGLRYGHLVVESRLDALPEGSPPNKADVWVDPVEFRAAVEATLEQAAAAV
jgi:hypothetical protein